MWFAGFLLWLSELEDEVDFRDETYCPLVGKVAPSLEDDVFVEGVFGPNRGEPSVTVPRLNEIRVQIQVSVPELDVAIYSEKNAVTASLQSIPYVGPEYSEIV